MTDKWPLFDALEKVSKSRSNYWWSTVFRSFRKPGVCVFTPSYTALYAALPSEIRYRLQDEALDPQFVDNVLTLFFATHYESKGCFLSACRYKGFHDVSDFFLQSE